MSRWIAKARRLDRRRIDQALAAVLIVAGEIELLVQWDGDTGLLVNALVLGVAYATVAWRRTQPLLAVVVMLGCWIFMNVFLTEVEPLQIPLVGVLRLLLAGQSQATQGAPDRRQAAGEAAAPPQLPRRP